jgi:hypothetical protein
MRFLYVEGLAGHDGPEPCVDAREGGGEALAGVHAGRVLSRKMLNSRVPTLWRKAEGNMGDALWQSSVPALRGLRPRARMQATWKGTGISTG